MARTTLGLAFALAAALAPAQALEVISLKYRTADQVLDTLRPLVELGGALTGQGNQLILRGSTTVSSTVGGRLGEWFELGSVATGGETRRVWVRVEAIGN